MQIEEQITQLLKENEELKNRLTVIEESLSNLKDRVISISLGHGLSIVGVMDEIDEIYYRLHDIQDYGLW